MAKETEMETETGDVTGTLALLRCVDALANSFEKIIGKLEVMAQDEILLAVEKSEGYRRFLKQTQGGAEATDSLDYLVEKSQQATSAFNIMLSYLHKQMGSASGLAEFDFDADDAEGDE